MSRNLGDLETVLLVEDDLVDRMTVQRSFQKADLNVDLIEAGNGLEALEWLKDESHSLRGLLVLLDLNMPRMGGIEFLKAVRADERLRLLPVVVLTTSDEERDKVDAYNLNVAGYLIKPVSLDAFLELVDRLASYWALNRLPKV